MVPAWDYRLQLETSSEVDFSVVCQNTEGFLASHYYHIELTLENEGLDSIQLRCLKTAVFDKIVAELRPISRHYISVHRVLNRCIEHFSLY
jgi:hypothetical protein